MPFGPASYDEPVTLARAETERGTLALRRRTHPCEPVYELIANGTFAMDSADTSTERLLARIGLRGRPDTPASLRVVVAGLGLGFTVDEVLRDSTVGRVDVVELEPSIVDWIDGGLIPATAHVLHDRRVRRHVTDIARWVAEAEPASVDVLLLDVDNGPDFLVHQHNARLYDAPFLRQIRHLLRPGGRLVVWSAEPSTALTKALGNTFDGCEETRPTVTRQARTMGYALYCAHLLEPSEPSELSEPSEPTDRGRYPLDHVGSDTLPPVSRTEVISSGVMGDQQEFRIEHDTMGEVRVPTWAKWRAQTQRAVENFPISGATLEREHIRALAQIKAAAATVNVELGVVDSTIGDGIATVAAQVADGGYDAHFPIDVFQTGSGTSSNMNTNEVVATLSSEALGSDVHPNDHVNASQSSNDVFPSSIHIAATNAVVGDLIPALEQLAASYDAKATEFAQVVKSGRTHLMDATPVTLGQEFDGYAAATRHGIERLQASLPRLAELPLGGTAVGTGINTPPGFATKVITELARTTGLPLTEARDHFEAQGARDGLVEVSGQLRTIAVGLYKAANDIRWMGSGPRTGLAELALPDLQPGSSIMPGKVNPVICEAARQVVAQVTGNDSTVAFSGSQGDFELNVMLPVMARNVLESIRLLANVSRLFADRLVDGLTANTERAREYAESSPSVVTPLNRYIGYDNAAKVAKTAVAERMTIRQVVIEQGYVERGDLTEAQLDEALDVLSMTHP